MESNKGLLFLHGWCCSPTDFKAQVEHSMGGVFGLVLAQKLKILCKGLVVVDTTLFTQNNEDFFTELSSKDGKEYLEKFIKSMMIDMDVDNVELMNLKKSEMISLWSRAPFCFNQILKLAKQLDKSAIISDLQHLPIIYLARRNSTLDSNELHKLKKDINMIYCESGHFISLNKPDVLIKAIDQLI